MAPACNSLQQFHVLRQQYQTKPLTRLVLTASIRTDGAPPTLSTILTCSICPVFLHCPFPTPLCNDIQLAWPTCEHYYTHTVHSAACKYHCLVVCSFTGIGGTVCTVCDAQSSSKLVAPHHNSTASRGPGCIQLSGENCIDALSLCIVTCSMQHEMLAFMTALSD